MTNLEGRVILRQRAVAPPDGVRSDLDVLAGLAARLGSPVPFATDPEEVFAELGRASAGGRADYAGITYDRIREEHGRLLALPRPPTTPGTPRMFLDAFAHPDGRARFLAVEHRGAGRAAVRGLPGAPDHRPGARAVPVRRPDPPGPRPARRPAPSSSCTRCWPAGSAPPTASRSRSPPGAAR